jgi:hypothetical protein
MFNSITVVLTRINCSAVPRKRSHAKIDILVHVTRVPPSLVSSSHLSETRRSPLPHPALSRMGHSNSQPRSEQGSTGSAAQNNQKVAAGDVMEEATKKSGLRESPAVTSSTWLGSVDSACMYPGTKS